MANNIRNNRDDVFGRLVQLIRGMLKVSQEEGMRKFPEIQRETDIFNELGIDSVEVMDLITMIEKEFGIAIELENVAAKRTLGQIADHVDELLQRA